MGGGETETRPQRDQTVEKCCNPELKKPLLTASATLQYEDKASFEYAQNSSYLQQGDEYKL